MRGFLQGVCCCWGYADIDREEDGEECSYRGKDGVLISHVHTRISTHIRSQDLDSNHLEVD